MTTMATPDEVLRIIRPMPDAEWKALQARSISGYTKEQYAELVVGDPKAEAIICRALGLPTEADKAIWFSRWSFYLVIIATVFAAGSFVLGLLPFLK